MGVAIVVNDVDWTASAVTTVTLKESGGGGTGPVTAIKAMYLAYLEKSGRAENLSLLAMMTDLYKAQLLQKCTGLFYLASDTNNLEHIKYSIIDLRALTVGTGTPIVSSSGVKANGGRGFNDPGRYDINTKGFAAVFMISEAATGKGFDWGGDLGKSNNATYFSSGGGYTGGTTGNTATVMWASKVVFNNSEDTQARIGVFTWYTEGNIRQVYTWFCR